MSKKWAKNIIRTKGVCYFNVNPEMSYLFEQAGVQKKVTEAGQWFCTAPEEELKEILAENPEILNDWDEKYGDKIIVGKCDVEENDDLAAEFGVRNIPTVLFFKNGQQVDKFVGAASKQVFEQKFQSLIG